MHKFNTASLWCCRDICAYVRAVIFTIAMLVFVATLIGGLIALAVGDSLAWIAACISLGTFVDVGVGPVMVITIVGLIALFNGFYLFDMWLRDRTYADPGAVRLAYMSWKDKYCAKITFDYIQDK